MINSKPALIRSGGLKASIWRNQSSDDTQKVRYTVNYIRSYKNADGGWKDSTSFSEIDNLKLGQLIPKVADRINELKQSDRQQASDEE